MERNDKPLDVINDLKVVFSPDAWAKINGYIKGVDSEISGLGQAVIEKNRVYITDIFLWEQQNSSATTDVLTTKGQQNGAIFDLVAELTAKGITTKNLIVWWHSHYNFDPFFSGTDHATIENWLSDTILCAVVGNQRGEYKSIVAVKNPVNVKVECPVLYEQYKNEEIDREIAENIKAKIKTPPAIEYPKDHSPNYSHDKYNGQMWGGRDYRDYDIPPSSSYGYDDLDYAEMCMCDLCLKVMNGENVEFNYNAHTWSSGENRFIPKGKKQMKKSWDRLTNQMRKPRTTAH